MDMMYHRHAAVLGVSLLVWMVATPSLGSASDTAARHSSKVDFWNGQRKGANCQNGSVTPEYWQAARTAGIQFIRLAPNGWPSARRDFLIGDADSFRTLDQADLARLRAALRDAHRAGVKVVLTMFSLPGARWRQVNGDQDDARLWTEPRFRDQAFAFWRQLAAELRGDSAIVAYNPLNEPHPERAFRMDAHQPRFPAWRDSIRGTAADLDAFNRGIVAAIRASDPETPIILDGWSYSSPEGLVFVEPVEDSAVLYSLHNFGPWEYTTYRINKGRYAYRDRMPEGWTPETYERQATAIDAWAKSHGIPANRIIAEEFWVDRRVPGARLYLEDIVSLLNRRRWHWAFYAFRPDGWGGLDYELGTAPLGAAYWDAVERNQDAEHLKRRGPNPLWDVLEQALAAP
jgi:endoglucanase